MPTQSDSTKPNDEKADCYASGERAAMVWYAELRERWLGPLLRIMAGVGLRPDHLTILSLILGLLFCPLYFWSPALAFIALLLHALVDGIDGPLARHLSVDSKAGSFTDTTCDQIVVVAVTLTMMCHPARFIPVPAGTIYIFLYTIVVVFAMVRNAMGIPYSWVVRPRLVVYGWLLLETFVFPGTWLERSIVKVLWTANVLFLLRMISGFFKIRANLN